MTDRPSMDVDDTVRPLFAGAELSCARCSASFAMLHLALWIPRTVYEVLDNLLRYGTLNKTEQLQHKCHMVELFSCCEALPRLLKTIGTFEMGGTRATQRRNREEEQDAEMPRFQVPQPKARQAACAHAMTCLLSLLLGFHPFMMMIYPPTI